MDSTFRLWAKTNELQFDYSAENWDYHPLVCHLLDVACVAKLYLEQCPFLLDKFYDLSTKHIEKGELSRVIQCVAALHDIGKISWNFQRKSEKGWQSAFPDKSRPANTPYDHGEGGLFLLDVAGVKSNIEWIAPNIQLLAASCSHHGVRYNTQIAHSKSLVREYLRVKSSFETLLDCLEAVLQVKIPGQQIGGNEFCMLLAGFVSVCDWIGSNEVYFPYHKIESTDDVYEYWQAKNQDPRVLGVLETLGILPNLLTTPQTYSTLFGFDSPRDFQREVLDIEFGKSSGPELMVIEAPMGGGKTEAALEAIARCLSGKNAQGFFFALPTQASSNALFDRIDSFARRVTPAGVVNSLALVHGNNVYAQPFKEFLFRTSRVEIKASPSDVHDSGMEGNVVLHDWLFSKKRTMLSVFGVGTIDQMLMSVLPVKHSFVRFFSLAQKVVVLDEVHAYDVYMNALIGRLLRWFRALGCKVILLSATLPTGLMKELLSGFWDDLFVPEDVEELKHYPLAIATSQPKNNNLAVQHTPPIEVTPEEPIHVSICESEVAETIDAGLSIIEKELEAGGCCAWIRNTVSSAQEAYLAATERFDESFEVYLLHARFTQNDRAVLEQVVLDKFGKHNPEKRPEKAVVIATQVIEQSIDIDFDVMLSDIAPVDLLLQRAGRLWRHSRTTAQRQGISSRRLHVLVPPHEQRMRLQFANTVYAPEILQRTYQLIVRHQTWLLPYDCRMLVTELYDRESTWNEQTLDVRADDLAAARNLVQEQRLKMSSTAEMSLIGTPSQPQGFHLVDISEDSAAVSTRFGMEDSHQLILFVEVEDGRYAPYSDKAVVFSIQTEDDSIPALRANLRQECATSTVSIHSKVFPRVPKSNEHDLLLAALKRLKCVVFGIPVLLDSENSFVLNLGHQTRVYQYSDSESRLTLGLIGMKAE